MLASKSQLFQTLDLLEAPHQKVVAHFVATKSDPVSSETFQKVLRSKSALETYNQVRKQLLAS